MKQNDKHFKKPLVTPPPTPSTGLTPNDSTISNPGVLPPIPKKENLTTKEDLRHEKPFQTKDLLSKDEKEKLNHFSSNKEEKHDEHDYTLTTKKNLDTDTKKRENKREDEENMRGELTYDDKVIQKIVGVALGEIDGLLSVDGGFFSNLKDKLINSDDVTAGIETEVGKKQVAVDMDVIVEYGKDIQEIFEQTKEVIQREVQHMTHLEVVEVNVNVVDIKTKEQHEKDSETVQDKLTDTWEDTKEFASKQTDKAKDALGKGKDKIEEAAEKGKEKMEEKTEPRVE